MSGLHSLTYDQHTTLSPVSRERELDNINWSSLCLVIAAGYLTGQARLGHMCMKCVVRLESSFG